MDENIKEQIINELEAQNIILEHGENTIVIQNLNVENIIIINDGKPEIIKSKKDDVKPPYVNLGPGLRVMGKVSKSNKKDITFIDRMYKLTSQDQAFKWINETSCPYCGETKKYDSSIEKDILQTNLERKGIIRNPGYLQPAFIETKFLGLIRIYKYRTFCYSCRKDIYSKPFRKVNS